MLTERPELIDARWIHDETVVHFLAIEGFAEGVGFLLRRGAAVDLPNAFGDSPLGDAAALGLTDIVAVLVLRRERPTGDRP